MTNEPVLNQYVPNILIVDDIPDNLKVLCDMLEGDGYKVRPVPSGALALQVAAKEKPDLILLDIMMPGMDGFEVCRLLKENPKLNDVPIIFISALSDMSDIVKALKAGGVDYITKPFQTEEVKARVATHIKICLQNQELKKLYSEKDKFFSLIAHDLRGPLSGFMLLSEMIIDDAEQFTPEKKKDWTIKLNRSARSVFHLLENLLEWSQMQRGNFVFTPELLSLENVVVESLETVNDSVVKKSIELTTDIPIGIKVFADINMLQSVIRNLVSNAIKFTPKGGSVCISANIAANNACIITVKDSGIGMNPEMLNNLLRLGANTRRTGTDGEASSGLGLMLCKEFIEKHGGNIWMESEVGKGSDFKFSIPSLSI